MRYNLGRAGKRGKYIPYSTVGDKRCSTRYVLNVRVPRYMLQLSIRRSTKNCDEL